jgi:hypothetical protein
MKRKERFETLLALAMLILSATISIMSVSLNLPTIATYFFLGMVLLFAAIVIANIY